MAVGVALAAVWGSCLIADADTDSKKPSHWAFVRLERPAAPRLDVDTGSNPIDSFIRSALLERKISPVAPTDRRTLIRRLSLDLLGLPPSEDEVQAFLDDGEPEAHQKLVDRLLASPRYGERWGRHWLDVARFAESEGYAENTDWPYIWRYRDWVVDSFNHDRPFSEFALAQVAGDELAPYADENLIATGFLATARVSGDEASNIRQINDLYVDIVNATSSAFLGLTMNCAQCHDHKFDPLTLEDYYRLQAFFVQGLPGNVVLRRGAGSPDPATLAKTALALAQKTIETRSRVLGEAYDEEPDKTRRVCKTSEDKRTIAEEGLYRATRARLNIRIAGCNAFRLTEDEKKQLAELRAKLDGLSKPVTQTWGFYSPVTSPHAVSVLPMQANFSIVHDLDVLRRTRAYAFGRGDPYAPEKIVSPGYPVILGGGDADPASPRSSLGRWLASRENPLTARVWVNRIWHYHFGRGLVATPGNFGVRGAKPSHPALLDWLAMELVESGWSTKHIHRRIVTSRTYRRSGRFHAPSVKLDPGNQLLWRFPRRRLEAEAIRDSILAACGELDLRYGGPSEKAAAGSDGRRRSVYLFQKRDVPPTSLALFDGPTAMAQSCATRPTSTSALQSLHLLNNESFLVRSRRFANRVRAESGDNLEKQVRTAFREALQREPERLELEASLDFLRDFDPTEATRDDPRIVRVEVSEGGRAAIDGDVIESWAQLRPTSGAHPPRFVAHSERGINGEPVVRFSGQHGINASFLAIPDSDEIDFTTGYTFFAVARFLGTGQGNGVVFLKAGNGGNSPGALGLLRLHGSGKLAIGQNIDGQWSDRIFSAESIPYKVPVLVIGRFDGEKIELDVVSAAGKISSASAELRGRIDPGAGGELSVGGYVDAFSDFGERLNGDVGELLLFREALSDAKRDAISKALVRRWLDPNRPAKLPDTMAALVRAEPQLALWLRAGRQVRVPRPGAQVVLSQDANAAPALYGSDPSRAAITYRFDRPVQVSDLELIVHREGVTEIEGFAGDDEGALVSIGTARGQRENGELARVGKPYSEDRAARVFSFRESQQRPGRVFRFFVRETVSPATFTNYAAFPRPVNGSRIAAVPSILQSRSPESNLVLFCQALLNLNEFLTVE